MQTVITANCPYCWQNIPIEIDAYETQLEYVQDCSVCCNPIIFYVSFQNDEPQIQTKKEHE